MPRFHRVACFSIHTSNIANASSRKSSTASSSKANKPSDPLPEPWRKHVTIRKTFPLVLGGCLKELEIEYTDWTTHPSFYNAETGELDEAGMHAATLQGELPVVYIMPSMSHSAHVSRPPHLRTDASTCALGWWEHTVGDGQNFGVDTRQVRVICASPLGAPYGTTSPISRIPGDPSGRQYRASFPVITPSDQAQAHRWLLEYLGLALPLNSEGYEIEAKSNICGPAVGRPPRILHGLVGSSMGGMQALAFGARYPGMFRRLAAICCTGRTSPSTVALRSVQRDAVRADPAFCSGDYAPEQGPFTGMGIARKVGTIAYRSRTEFDSRFAWAARPVAETTNEQNEANTGGSSDTCRQHDKIQSLRFEVEDYLEHQAKNFMTRYDANCYLTLSKCMDLMDIGRDYDGYEDGVRRMALSKAEFTREAKTQSNPQSSTAAIASTGTQSSRHRQIHHMDYNPHTSSSHSTPDANHAPVLKSPPLDQDDTVGAEFMLLPVTQDALIPAHEMASLASILGSKAKAQVHFESLNSLYGHDAFLLEHNLYNPRLAAFFDPTTRRQAPGAGVDAVRKATRIPE